MACPQAVCSSARRRIRGTSRSERDLLRSLDYSLQANVKTREGARHPDRDAQFRYLNEQVRAFGQRGEPVLSVDTTKKELVGPFKNGGREWQPHGQPESVNVHDCADKRLGKAIPYGIYDVGRNTGWVSVGQDHDTAAFAVESLRRWWRTVGSTTYPHAHELLLCADGGGSNGSRLHARAPAAAAVAPRSGHGCAEGAYVGSDRCTTGLMRHRPATGMMRVRQQPGLYAGRAAGGCAW
jgi:hypothetical protein